jgi:hypothetical protein
MNQKSNVTSISLEEFRLEVAGVVDTFKKLEVEDQEDLKMEIIKFISILPELFSSDLDRKTLWERIGNGLLASIAKAGDDIDMFINCSLDYIKAEPGKVAANESLISFVDIISTKSLEWKVEFLKLIEKKYFLFLIHARDLWRKKYDDKKEKIIEEKIRVRKRKNMKKELDLFQEEENE